MARRIREFDWSGHPLGPADSWPTALRSALGIALNSAFPTCIYWGSDLRLLYNDAWSTIPGPRHPACLGERAADVWSDIWHVIEPQFAELIISGEGVYVRDQLLPMRRFGVEEETYWDYNFTPIRNDDGSIGGIFNSGNETTERVLQERNTRFLLELSDAFRGLREADMVRSLPLEMLGHHLEVDRVGLRQHVMTENGNPLPIVAQLTAPGARPVSEDEGRSALSGEIRAELLDGDVIRFDGSDTDRRSIEADMLRALGCASALAVPWVEDGETVAILFVHSFRERHWTDLEVQTVEAVLGRMMAWMERARAVERERVLSREIDHRARNLLSVVQSIIRLAKPEDPKVMQDKLLDRVAALAKTHSLLSDKKWESLALSQLVDEELAPYVDTGGTDISRSGPEIILAPDHTQALAMVLHELGTNAAKHGALSHTGGSLAVDWALTSSGHLRIEWTEKCPEQPKRVSAGESGFGTRLLTLIVEAQMEGRIVHKLTGTGLHCVIEVPWSDRERPQRVR